MAYIYQPQEGLTREQAEMLRELNSFQQVSDSAAWKKLRERLDATVDESREECLGCAPETTMEQRAILQMRWQQREAIRRDLLAFMDSHVEHRKQLLDELKEQNEYTSSDSGSTD